MFAKGGAGNSALQSGLQGASKSAQNQPMQRPGGAPQISAPQAPMVDPSMFQSAQAPQGVQSPMGNGPMFGLQKPKNLFFGQ
jgi:hypothetical protein